jgi:hypothetical protein
VQRETQWSVDSKVLGVTASVKLHPRIPLAIFVELELASPAVVTGHGDEPNTTDSQRNRYSSVTVGLAYRR